MTITKTEFTTKCGELCVYVRVAPFCIPPFCDDGSEKLGLILSLQENAPNIGCVFLYDNPLARTFDDKKVAAVVRSYLRKNGTKELELAETKYAEWQIRANALDDMIRNEAAAKDVAMRKRGYTKKVTAVVHSNTGSDTVLTMYADNSVTDREVQAMLKRRRSVVLNDYRIDTL